MRSHASLPERIRPEYPVAEKCTWLVGGVVNPVSTSVAERVQDELAEWFTWGAPHVLQPDVEAEGRSRAIATIAASVGSSERDVALVRGVGEGYQNLLRGIDWRRGDRVLLSDDEEAALLLPTLHLARHEGVAVDVVSPRADGRYYAEDFGERITPRTRLVAFSEVTTEFGRRLPARAIVRMAHDAGCLSYVDMAHSAGIGRSDLAELGCDAAGILSYKWHYGPYGLGLFYLSERARTQVRLRYAGGRSHVRLAHPAGPYTLRPGTQAYQYGPWLWATVAGWAWAVEQLAELGLELVADHTAAMTSRLKEEARRIAGVTVATPLAPEHSAALVTLRHSGYTSSQLRGALWSQFGIRVKALENTAGVRVGVCHFTNADDIDRLIDGLHAIAHASSKLPSEKPTKDGT